MKQNIYDTQVFFDAYQRMRTAPNVNDDLERPVMESLLPIDFADKTVLDLGSGDGIQMEYVLERGATKVVGVEISSKMTELAATRLARMSTSRYELINRSIEEYTPTAHFDVVMSCMALHYVPDFGKELLRIAEFIRPNGVLAISVKHPIQTALGSLLDQTSGGEMKYCSEGVRVCNWLTGGVKNYHQPLSKTINSVLDAGLILERVLEPPLDKEVITQTPRLGVFLDVPACFFLRARKPARATSLSKLGEADAQERSPGKRRGASRSAHDQS